jgi:tetratricopeptide (TPR) repeat protein
LLEQARQIYDTFKAYNSVGAVLASLLLVWADHDLNGFVWAEKCLSDLHEKVKTAGYQYGTALVKQSMADLSYLNGDHVSAMALWQESSELFVQLEDVWAVQDVLQRLMWRKCMRGEYEDAIRLVNQNLLFFEDYGDPNGVGWCYNALGTIARDQGKYEAAQRYYMDAAALGAETGDRWWSIYLAERLACLHYCEGKLAEARAEYKALLAQLQDVPTEGNFGFFHARAAWVSLRENRLEEARQMLAVGLAVLRITSPEDNIYAAYYGLGELARLEGNYPEAIENYLASLRALNTGQLYVGFPETLNGLAKTGLMQSKLEYAARLFGVSEALCKKMEIVINLVDRPDYDKHIELLKSKMSAEEFESAWAEGAKMSIEEMLVFSMQEGG